MQFTMLLNHNEFSLETAEAWEAKVFIRNIKSFNHALGNDYHTDMTGPVEGMPYNDYLVGNVTEFMANWTRDHPDEPMVPIKVDYLAERSIEDNIKLESS